MFLRVNKLRCILFNWVLKTPLLCSGNITESSQRFYPIMLVWCSIVNVDQVNMPGGLTNFWVIVKNGGSIPQGKYLFKFHNKNTWTISKLWTDTWHNLIQKMGQQTGVGNFVGMKWFYSFCVPQLLLLSLKRGFCWHCDPTKNYAMIHIEQVNPPFHRWPKVDLGTAK